MVCGAIPPCFPASVPAVPCSRLAQAKSLKPELSTVGGHTHIRILTLTYLAPNSSVYHETIYFLFLLVFLASLQSSLLQVISYFIVFYSIVFNLKIGKQFILSFKSCIWGLPLARLRLCIPVCLLLLNWFVSRQRGCLLQLLPLRSIADHWAGESHINSSSLIAIAIWGHYTLRWIQPVTY